MDAELASVLDRVHQARGFRCDAYKETCLKRRLAVRMRATGAHTFAEYADVLDRDAEEVDRLLRAFTINVTSFYRNAETWNALLERFLPERWMARQGRLVCWSAGCASGEEPLTMAMVLCELARRQGIPPIRCASRVIATDVDQGALDAASRGDYEAKSFAELPNAFRERYVVAGSSDGRWTVAGDVRRLVDFVRHDLVQDAAPAVPVDLIVCRNVLIYFDRPTQEAIFSNMADALNPGGLLVLGKTETLFGENVRSRFRLLDIPERVYARS